MTLQETIKLLKEIKEGKEGQVIPFDIIKRSLVPIQERACLDEVIYLLERIEE